MKPVEVGQNNQTATRLPNRSHAIDSGRRILTWADRGALMTMAPELLAEAPQIEHVDVLVAKIPH